MYETNISIQESVSLPHVENYSLPIRRAIKHIVEHVEEKVTLDDLAEVSGYSKFYFNRYFNAHVGVTPMKWLSLYRVVLSFLRITSEAYPSMTEIAMAHGFSSPSHLSSLFKQTFGLTPMKAHELYQQSLIKDGDFPNEAVRITSQKDLAAAAFRTCIEKRLCKVLG